MKKRQFLGTAAVAGLSAALPAHAAAPAGPTLLTVSGAITRANRGKLDPARDVMRAAGAQLGDDTKLILRAVDGYAAAVTVAQARAQRWIVATHMDGAPMALGGLGPLWALCEADKVPELAAIPLAGRFGGAPWALYHIEVRL